MNVTRSLIAGKGCDRCRYQLVVTHLTEREIALGRTAAQDGGAGEGGEGGRTQNNEPFPSPEHLCSPPRRQVLSRGCARKKKKELPLLCLETCPFWMISTTHLHHVRNVVQYQEANN